MSVDLSISFCYVISVIVRKCCGLRLAVPKANKHNYQIIPIVAHRHTVPTAKKTYRWHLFDWTCSFYIVHLCLTFQTVGVQNPQHDCVQLPCCRHHTWKQWDNTWMLGKWLLSFWRSSLVSCERVVRDDLNPHFYLSFWRSNLISCERVATQFSLSFWRSNLVSCERVAFRAVSLALPLPPPSEEK